MRGPAKLYERACFETRSFSAGQIIRLRPIDGRQSNPLRGRDELGRRYACLLQHARYVASIQVRQKSRRSLAQRGRFLRATARPT
jgi:hypothetical protein